MDAALWRKSLAVLDSWAVAYLHTRRTESVISKAHRTARTGLGRLAVDGSGARTRTGTYKQSSWIGFCVYLEPCRLQILKET